MHSSEHLPHPHRFQFLALLTLPLLALCSFSTFAADPVYTWTDPAGVTHFSEEPPVGSVGPARTIVPEVAPAPPLTTDKDYFSVMNQARRMEASRRERERLQLQRQALENERRERQPAQVILEDTQSYPAVYPYRYYDKRDYYRKRHPDRYDRGYSRDRDLDHSGYSRRGRHDKPPPYYRRQNVPTSRRHDPRPPVQRARGRIYGER